MMPRVTTLPSGLRIASHAMDHVETVSLGVWVAAGARDETEREHGISHLLEHMAFKGTLTRSARRIAEDIEQVGGELNAATGLDSTAYFARVLKGDERVAIEILADILLNSAFDPAELDRERDVILQEIAACDDSPDDLAFDLVQEAAFPGQSVGRPILGTPKSVKSIKPADLRAFLAFHYHPGNMVIAAAGAINHDRLVCHVEALFGGLTNFRKIAPDAPAVNLARYEGGHSGSERRFEQSHLVIGLPAPSCLDAAYYTAQVFSGLFGGGMSSRLFQELRERRGLCYSVYSSVWGLKDAGMLTIHAATGSDQVEASAALIATELAGLADAGPDAAEMQRAKAQLKAGLLMALENSSVRAEQMARHLLLHDRFISSEELCAAVDHVDAAAVRNFAAELSRAKASVAVVGSGRRSKSQAAFAAAQFAPPFLASA